ncbi:hypothetical protein HDV62DRAFT_9746 [Trichoderma sp. SZMC 28011]
MPGAASRIKPFHAHDDTVVLHALILCFWTLLLSILRTRHVSVFAFWPLIFPSKLRGGSPLFSICLDGDEPWAARIPHCDPSLYRLSMGLFKMRRENGHTDPSHHQHSLLGYFLPGFWQLMPVMHIEEQCHTALWHNPHTGELLYPRLTTKTFGSSLDGMTCPLFSISSFPITGIFLAHTHFLK